MEKIIKYRTFDDKEFFSFEGARKHLIGLENVIFNTISCALASCDVSKITNQNDRDFLKRSEDTDTFMFRRHYAMYYLDENLHLFAELQRIKSDLTVSNDDCEE